MIAMLTALSPYGLAVATLLFGVASAHAQSSGTCLVQRVEGAAVVSAGGAAQRPAEPGLALGPNDTLRTPSASRVTLACSDNLMVVVGPDSEITVEGLLAGNVRPFGLRLLDGIAGFLFKGSSGVQVRTPSAVAAVRSTEWAMRVHNGVSEVFTRAGTVSVAADGGSARLGPGDGVDVSNTGELKPVVQWRPPRIARFAELLGSDW
jgi:hypothetical protein